MNIFLSMPSKAEKRKLEKVAAEAGKIGPAEKQSKSSEPVVSKQKSVATASKPRKVVEFISWDWLEDFGVAAEEEFSDDDDEEIIENG